MELIQEKENNYKFTDDFINIQKELDLLNESSCNLKMNNSKNTIKFLLEMYNNISNAKNDFNKLKDKQFNLFKITSPSMIPKPKELNNNFVPDNILNSINKNASYYLSYNYKLKKKTVSIKLVVFENLFFQLTEYYKYNEMIYVITHILEKYSSVECGKNLNIYIYLTDFKKIIPSSQLIELDTEHVNSAYSDVCVKNSEIVIFRKEEWIKVLIHELFHNYGLDFSKINYQSIKKKVKDIFPIKSEFELTESYAEFFGEMINITITSYYLYPELSIDLFIKKTLSLINYERIFSIYQCVKILNIIGIRYENLYLNDEISVSLRKTIYYYENTNVFCYYVLKMILLFYCDEFIQFCYEKNFHLLDFRKSESVLNSFYEFILQHYQSKKLINSIKNIEKTCVNIKDPFCIQTSRISCVEMN